MTGGKNLWVEELRNEIRSVKFLTVDHIAAFLCTSNSTKDRFFFPKCFNRLKAPRRQGPDILHQYILHFTINHSRVLSECRFSVSESAVGPETLNF